MKYVHSIWSSPSIKNNYENTHDAKFLEKNFYSYFLSALLIKKLGYKIELYCDKYAYDMYSLIPYDKITVVDFDSDGIDSKYWFYGKIKTQLLMTEPYVHIDGDVFMFRDIIGNKLNNGYKAVVQSLENNFTIGKSFTDIYINSISPFLNLKNYDINWYKYGIEAYNCGVIGFSDMELKNKYVNKVIELLKNISNNDEFNFVKIKYEGIILIAEQSTLLYVLEENNIKPLEIIPTNDKNWIHTIPHVIGYCHMWSYSKYKASTIEKIKYKINKFFPQYSEIINLFENKYNKK